MITIQLDLSDTQFGWLQNRAKELGLASVEAYVHYLVNQAAGKEAEFEAITKYVLAKNSELYQRLA